MTRIRRIKIKNSTAPDKVVAVRRGEIVPIQTIISHEMHNGRMRDQKTGEVIEKKIIEWFVVTFNGMEVFRAKFYTAISTNPYVAFYLKISVPGELLFTWTENGGTSWSIKRQVKIS